VDNTTKHRSDQGAQPALHFALFSDAYQSYNLVYELDPVRAFDLKLVKQIVVDPL